MCDSHCLTVVRQSLALRMPAHRPSRSPTNSFLELPPGLRLPEDSAPPRGRLEFPATESRRSKPLPVRGAGCLTPLRAHFAGLHLESKRAVAPCSGPRVTANHAALSSQAAAFGS